MRESDPDDWHLYHAPCFTNCVSELSTLVLAEKGEQTILTSGAADLAVLAKLAR